MRDLPHLGNAQLVAFNSLICALVCRSSCCAALRNAANVVTQMFATAKMCAMSKATGTVGCCGRAVPFSIKIYFFANSVAVVQCDATKPFNPLILVRSQDTLQQLLVLFSNRSVLKRRLGYLLHPATLASCGDNDARCRSAPAVAVRMRERERVGWCWHLEAEEQLTWCTHPKLSGSVAVSAERVGGVRAQHTSRCCLITHLPRALPIIWGECFNYLETN